jgi:hypothetical protein
MSDFIRDFLPELEGVSREPIPSWVDEIICSNCGERYPADQTQIHNGFPACRNWEKCGGIGWRHHIFHWGDEQVAYWRVPPKLKEFLGTLSGEALQELTTWFQEETRESLYETFDTLVNRAAMKAVEDQAMRMKKRKLEN